MLNWKHRKTKNGIIWDDGRFAIEWSPEAASWVLYDRSRKQHHRGLLSLGNAMDLAGDIAGQQHKIGLVACCKTKLTITTMAERLYCSDLFQKAAAYCRRQYYRWFI